MSKPALIRGKNKGIQLEIGYENSNPARKEAITRDEAGVFHIRQYVESGAGKGYSFHLNIALINKNKTPRLVTLKIYWGEAGYDDCARDYFYIGYDSGEKWRMLTISSRETVTDLKVVIPHGRHLLCYTPKFDYHDYLRLLKKYSSRGAIKVIPVAKTPEGREVKCFRMGNPAGKRMVITTRAHGYETAGAYCMSGLLRDIVVHPEAWREYLKKMELYVFPMINPDAVAAGNCCISTSGVNFFKDLGTERAGEKDCAAKKLTQFMLELRPHYYLDMHNNTSPHFEDSFRSHDKKLLEKFTRTAPDLSRHQKAWGIYPKEWRLEHPMAQCRQKYGTVYMVTEFPWYTRLPEDMEDAGIRFFKALFGVLAKRKTMMK